jgi:hypothetical protein
MFTAVRKYFTSTGEHRSSTEEDSSQSDHSDEHDEEDAQGKVSHQEKAYQDDDFLVDDCKQQEGR